MSGVFACACSAAGPGTMADAPATTLDVPDGDPQRHGKCYCLSRTERLEIISLVAAADMSECSAWVIPMLERGDF